MNEAKTVNVGFGFCLLILGLCLTPIGVGIFIMMYAICYIIYAMFKKD